MIGRIRNLIGFAALASGLALVPGFVPAQQAQAPVPIVRIGMVGSLFRDVPPGFVQLLMPPFQSLMREQTGLQGEIVTGGDARDVGKRLDEKDVQLGVFHGFEFAWAQHQYPSLRPLVVAINRQHSPRAYLVIRNDNAAANLAELKGTTISIPRRTREYCWLFLDRELAKLGADQKNFFGQVLHHSSMEDALDDILRGAVQMVVIDSVALENYQQVKPPCFARLKMLKESAPFPPGVVAYREGAIDNATLAKFKDGMITANQNPRGKELMNTWKLTAFENVPADFDQVLADVLKAFPPPAK